MSEVPALLVLHGAIDRAVQADPTLTDAVARFYPPYEGSAATGWFDEFERWTARLDGAEATVGLRTDVDALGVATRELAESPRSPTLAARRLLVVAVAARALPPGTVETIDLAGALGVGDTGEPLFALLTDDAVFSGVGDWEQMVARALDTGLLTAEFAAQNPKPPCGATVVTVATAVGTVDAAALETNFCATDLTFEAATHFQNPETWRACHPLWCELTFTGRWSAAGNPIYHEVVSLDCAKPQNHWTASCDLEFATFSPPGTRIVSYDLERPREPGDSILVDQGSLIVTEQGGQICVQTTKRIAFAHAFGGPALVMLVCALGFGEVTQAFVRCCAAKPAPVPVPPGPGEGLATTGAPTGATDPVGRAMAAAKRAVQDSARDYQVAMAKATAGTYTADALVKDLSTMSIRIMRDAGTTIALGAGAARAVQKSRPAGQVGDEEVTPDE